MPECAKTRLQQSRISKFSGEDPRTLLFKGRGGKGKGGEEREGKRKGRREGKDREGRDGKGQGREGGGKGGMGVVGRGGEGRGARHGLRSLPPRDKLWIRPWLVLQLTFRVTTAGLCYS